MYLAVSGMEISIFSPLASAFLIALACSCSGVSGAFLLLPYQFTILGYTLPGVSATNQIFNILACPAGILRYAREGRLISPLAKCIALGSIPGVLLGAWARASIFQGAAQFRIFAACVLLYLGLRLLKNGGQGKDVQKAGRENQSQESKVSWKIEESILVLSWRGQKWQVHNGKVFWASFLTGLVGGIYGVGGGAMLSPVLVSYFGLPLHLLAGATLFGTFASSITGLASYSLMAWFLSMPQMLPDVGLGLLLGLGGIPGMYLGARLQKHLNGLVLKRLLCILTLFTGLFYVGQALWNMIH